MPKRLAITRKRRAFGRKMRKDLRARLADGRRAPLDPRSEVAVDLLPIVMSNVHFHYDPEVKLSRQADRDKKRKLEREQLREQKRALALTNGGVGDSLFPQSQEGGAAAAVAGTSFDALDQLSVTSSSDEASEDSKEEALDLGELRSVEMDLYQGLMVAIVGPPSQGKSTAMRLLAGQVFPLEKSLIPDDYIPSPAEVAANNKSKFSFNVPSPKGKPKKKLPSVPVGDMRERLQSSRISMDHSSLLSVIPGSRRGGLRKQDELAEGGAGNGNGGQQQQQQKRGRFGGFRMGRNSRESAAEAELPTSSSSSSSNSGVVTAERKPSADFEPTDMRPDAIGVSHDEFCENR